MNLTDSQLSQRGSEKLELSILSFFEQFRKMYVGDQAQKTSKVLSRISNPVAANIGDVIFKSFLLTRCIGGCPKDLDFMMNQMF